MSRRLQARSRTVATIVVDGNTLTIVHVYVHCRLREAMHAFMAELRQDIDPMYSDARDLLADALDRYKFIETYHVSIRR